MKRHEQNIETDNELLQIRQLADLGWQIQQLVEVHLHTRSSDSTTHDTPSTNPERRQLAQTADLLRQRRQLVVEQLRNSSVKATTWLCVTHIQTRQIRQQLDLARQARELVALQLQSTVNRGEKTNAHSNVPTAPSKWSAARSRPARSSACPSTAQRNESIRPKKRQRRLTLMAPLS